MTIDWPSFLFGAAVAYAIPVAAIVVIIMVPSVGSALVLGWQWLRALRATTKAMPDSWYDYAERSKAPPAKEEKKH